MTQQSELEPELPYSPLLAMGRGWPAGRRDIIEAHEIGAGTVRGAGRRVWSALTRARMQG